MTRDDVVREMAIATKETEEWSNFWSLQEVEALLRTVLCRAEECGWGLRPREPDYAMISAITRWSEKANIRGPHISVWQIMYDVGRKP